MGASMWKRGVVGSIFTCLLTLVLGAAFVPVAFANEGGSSLEAAGVSAVAPQINGIVVHEFARVASGEVSWDASTNTVTMTNATIDLGNQGILNPLYGIWVVGTNVSPTPTITLNLVGTNVIKNKSKITLHAIRVEDANLRVTGSGTLNVQVPSTLPAISTTGSFVADSGTLNVDGAGGGIKCEGDMTLSGAAISVTDARDEALSAGGSFAATSGSLKIAKCNYGIVCEKACMLDGKNVKVSMSSVKYRGVSADDFACKAGKLAISECDYGIRSEGAIKISGGMVKVASASNKALVAYGGKLQVTGGSVTAQCKSSSSYALYSSSTISTKPASLKKIKGRVGKGTTFTLKGNTYRVTDARKVALKSYGSKSKKATVDKAKYGGMSYTVTAIDAKAFATKRGRAITQIAMGRDVGSIGANAFNGTTKLVNMRVKRSSAYTWKLDKKAFAKCGKKSGAGLTVKCADKWDAAAMSKLFQKAGMSRKTSFQ